MGLWEPYAPAAKGPVTYCLDQLSEGSNLQSKGKSARDHLVELRDAIVKLGKGNLDFSGLEDVFAEHLLNYIYTDKGKVDKIRQYLKTYWFDEDSGWWPHFQPVSAIYANGLLKALNESLKTPETQPPIPIDSYWIIGHTTVEVVTLANQRQVTLLIATPFPLDPSPSGIWGESSEAWCTTRRAGEIPYEVDPKKNDSKVPSSAKWPLRVVTYKIKSRPQKT